MKSIKTTRHVSIDSISLNKLKETLNQNIEIQKSKVKVFNIHDKVSALSISGDDKYLAVGTYEGSILVYNLKTSLLKKNFDKVHSKVVQTIHFLADNMTIISGSTDSQIKIFKIINNQGDCELITSFSVGANLQIYQIKATRDNKYLLVATDRATVKVFDIASQSLHHTFDLIGCNIVYSLAISGDSRYFCTGTDDQSIRVFDFEKRRMIKEIKRAHDKAVLCLAMSPDNTYVISGSDDKSIRIHDIRNYSMVTTFNNAHDDPVTSVKVSENGKFVVSSSKDQSIRLFDIKTLQPIYELNKYHEGWIMSVSISRTNRYLISGSYDKTIKILDLHTQQFERDLQDYHEEAISQVAVANGYTFMATASDDRSIKIYDLGTNEVYHHAVDIHDDQILALQFTQDNKMLFSASADRSFKAFDIESKQIKHEFLNAHDRAITSLAITWDSQYAITGSEDNKIKIFNLRQTEEPFVFLDAHSATIMSLAISFHDDKKRIISGSQDGTLKVWNFATRDHKPEHEFTSLHDDSINSIAVTQDGKFAITASDDRNLRIVDLDSGDKSQPIKGVHDDQISCVCLSEDDRYIFTASYDRSIKIFDFETKRLVHTFQECHTDWINSIKVTTDQKYIISGSSDRSVKFFLNPTYRDAPISVNLDTTTPQNSLFGLMSLTTYLKSDEDSCRMLYVKYYPELFVSPMGWNHFHFVLAKFPKRNLIESCIENRVAFSLNYEDRTPLHYLLDNPNRDLGVINFIMGNFSEIILNSTQSHHEIMSSLSDMVPELLALDTPQVGNFLKFVVQKPKPYGSIEPARFGRIKGSSKRAYTPGKTMQLSPQVTKDLLEEDGSTLVDIRVLTLFSNYEPYSKDMFEIIKVLAQTTTEEIFRAKAISILIHYLWRKTRKFHMLLMSLWSVMMVFLSVIGIIKDRFLPGEIIVFVITCFFIIYEIFQMVYSGAKVYFSDIYNYVDILANLCVMFTLISIWAGVDNLAADWLYSITLFLNYTKWIAYSRVFDQFRQLIRMITEIVKDMRSFVMMLGLIIFGFSIIFHQFEEGDISYKDQLLNSYVFLYASFSTARFNDSQIVYFVIITMILSVVLLNMLIAIMGNTFGEVQSKSLLTDSQEKSSLILESIAVRRALRTTCCKRKKDKNIRRKYTSKYSLMRQTKNRYLFSCEEHKGDDDEDETYGEWEGHMNKLRNYIKGEVKFQSGENIKMVKEVEGKFDKKLKQVDLRIEKFDQKLDKLLETVTMAHMAQKKGGGSLDMIDKIGQKLDFTGGFMAKK